MATITKLASKNSEVLVDVGGTPTKLVACTDWAMNCERNTIDVSTISTEWKEFLTGQISATGSCNLIYDPTNEDAEGEIEDAMFDGQALNFHIRPEGTGTGKVEYTLPAYITTWNLTAATEDAIRVAVNFSGTGPIVKGVQA